jgi:hypothetical protein
LDILMHPNQKNMLQSHKTVPIFYKIYAMRDFFSAIPAKAGIYLPNETADSCFCRNDRQLRKACPCGNRGCTRRKIFPLSKEWQE